MIMYCTTITSIQAQDIRDKLNPLSNNDLNQYLLGMLQKLPVEERATQIIN